MGRRAERNNTVSFFALQDVMLGVIGIVILVTILFLLLRSTTQVGIPRPDAGVAMTRMESPATPEIVVRTIEPDAATRADRRGQVLDLNARLEESEREIAELRRELRLLLDAETLSGDAARISDLMDQLTDLEETLGDVQKKNRLTYLISEPGGLSPLVVELSRNRAVISREDSGENPYSIRAATIQETARRTIDFALAEKRDREYLLLVVKPSGIPLWSMIAGNPAIQRLPVGLDLIAERASTTDAFPGAAP